MSARYTSSSLYAAQAVLEKRSNHKEAANQYCVAVSTVYRTVGQFSPYTQANKKKLSKLIQQ